MTVYGNEWGMACNIIHYIDLFSWIDMNKIPKVVLNRLNKKIYKSKRKGFIEFYGNLVFESNNKTLSVTCKKSIDKKLFVKFEYPKKTYILDEITQEIETINKSSNKSFKRSFQNNLVSNTTKDIFLSMINGKRVKLSNFDLSKVYHKLFFNEFLRLF